jgi:hypothetical protein
VRLSRRGSLRFWLRFGARIRDSYRGCLTNRRSGDAYAGADLFGRRIRNLLCCSARAAAIDGGAFVALIFLSAIRPGWLSAWEADDESPCFSGITRRHRDLAPTRGVREPRVLPRAGVQDSRCKVSVAGAGMKRGASGAPFDISRQFSPAAPSCRSTVAGSDPPSSTAPVRRSSTGPCNYGRWN